MRMFIPQLFTLSNLLCGFLALHYAFQNNYVAAAWLVFLGVLDKMDGTIARRMGKSRFLVFNLILSRIFAHLVSYHRLLFIKTILNR